MKSSDGDSDAMNGTGKTERKKRPTMEEGTRSPAKFRASNEKKIKEWRRGQMPEIIQLQETSKAKTSKKRKEPEDTESQQPEKKRTYITGQDTDEEVIVGYSTGDNVPKPATTRQKRLGDRSFNRKQGSHRKFSQHLKEEVEGSGKLKRKVAKEWKEKYRDSQKKRVSERSGL